MPGTDITGAAKHHNSPPSGSLYRACILLHYARLTYSANIHYGQQPHGATGSALHYISCLVQLPQRCLLFSSAWATRSLGTTTKKGQFLQYKHILKSTFYLQLVYQWRSFRRSLVHYDPSGSGRVPAQVFLAVLQRHGVELSKNDQQTVVTSLDPQHTGAVDYAKFIDMLS